MTLNLQQAASGLAEKIAALPAGQRNVYLFTPTEAERDLMVPSEREFMMTVP